MVERDFYRLYTDCFTPIYKYVYFRVRDYDVATDITQDVFSKILEQKQDIDPETELRLLYTIARNKLIDYLRKKKSVNLAPGYEVEDLSIQSPDKHIMHKNDTELLLKLLDHLPDDDKEIIIMRHLQELEYSEIARITNKAESHVRQIVSRGIKKLKELYEQKT